MAHGHRYSTWEFGQSFVKKRDGTYEPFDPQKLRHGLAKALAVSDSDPRLDPLLAQIETVVAGADEQRKEPLSTTEIGRRALDGLLEIDPSQISHLRFATVFLKDSQFDRVNGLLDEVARLREKSGPPLFVRKNSVPSDGLWHVEPFDRSKLREAMSRALNKRPAASEAGTRIEELVERVHATALQRAQPDPKTAGQRVVDSAVIGDAALEALAGVDRLAFARFASVYREYKDVETFLDAMVDEFKNGKPEDRS